MLHIHGVTPAGGAGVRPDEDGTVHHTRTRTIRLDASCRQQCPGTATADRTQPTNPPAAPTAIPPVPTADIEATKELRCWSTRTRMRAASAVWVQDALDSGHSGTPRPLRTAGAFMENLNSAVQWVSIIVDAEDKDIISSKYGYHLQSGDTRQGGIISRGLVPGYRIQGPISKAMGGCGVRYRIDMPVEDSIYCVGTDAPELQRAEHRDAAAAHVPVLGQPGRRQAHAGQRRGCDHGVGGIIRRGRRARACWRPATAGAWAIQTFSDHDYHQADIIPPCGRTTSTGR